MSLTFTDWEPGIDALTEHANEWSRKSAEEHIADLLDAAKSGTVQTIVDFDGNFEVRFTAPPVIPVALGLNPPAEAQVESERSDETQIPVDPALPPND